MRLYRSEITRSNDTAESLLRRLGVSDSVAAAFIRNNPQARQALLGKAGRLVSAEADEQHQLLSLSARWARDDVSEFQRLVVAKADTGFSARLESGKLSVSSRMAGGLLPSLLIIGLLGVAVASGVRFFMQPARPHSPGAAS